MKSVSAANRHGCSHSLRVSVIETYRWFAILGFLLYAFAGSTGAEHPPTKNVLMLFPGNERYFDHWVRIESALRAHVPGQINFYHAYLEHSVIEENAYRENQAAAFRRTYAGVKLDLVIAANVDELQFAVEYRDKIFQGAPIVFTGVSIQELENQKMWPGVTGLEGRVGLRETIELALHLQPDTKAVAIIDLNAQRYWLAAAHSELLRYQDKVRVIDLLGPASGDMLEKVSALPAHTVVLFQLAPDSTRPAFGALDLLAAVAQRVPTYSAWPSLCLNYGCIGGAYKDVSKQVLWTAEIAARVLQGERPDDIPIAHDSDLQVTVDWRALRRWNIPESALPLGSLVLYREPTSWDRYWKYIVAAIALILAQSVLIGGLLWHRARRRMIEKSLVQKLKFESLLSDLSTDFINLSEEHVERNVEKGLRLIAEFLDIDSITLYEFSPDKTELTATFWCSDGVDLPPRVLKISEVRWWTNQVLSGEATSFSDLNDLPGEAASEKAYFRSRGIVSAASIPLKVAGEIIGAISFVSTNRQVIWSNDLVMQLGVMAEVFANMLRRRRTVSELKRAEAVLRESEERFRLVANQAPVLIWMSAPDKLCTYFNQPWLNFTGRSLEAELGKGWADSVHPEDLETCLATYSGSFDERRRFRMEYRLRRYDGQYRWIEDIGIPRFNADGSFAGYIGSCTDITDRKLIEMQLFELSAHLIKAQEEERSRIARELHDDLSQRLALLGIEIQTLQNNPKAKPLWAKLEALFQRVSEVCEDVHRLSHRLHPSVLDRLGLVPAVKSLCREVREQSGIELEVTCRDVPEGIPNEVSVCLFRVVQEAVGNVVKHSGAKEANVELVGSCNRIHLRVEDLGSGFEPSCNGNSGIGLLSMRERVRLVGGELVIQSGIAHGTIVDADIPLPSAELSDDTMAATA